MTKPTVPEQAVEVAAEACFAADWPKDDWKRFKPNDYVPERYRRIVRAGIEAALPLMGVQQTDENLKIQNYRLYEALEHIEGTVEKTKEWSEECARRRVHAENKWREVTLENAALRNQLALPPQNKE